MGLRSGDLMSFKFLAMLIHTLLLRSVCDVGPYTGPYSSILSDFTSDSVGISCQAYLLRPPFDIFLLGCQPRRHHGAGSSGSRRYHVIPVSGRAVSPLLRWLSGRPTGETVSSIRRSARHHCSARCANGREGWSRVYGGSIPVTQWDASMDHLQQGRRGDAELLPCREWVANLGCQPRYRKPSSS